nr:SKP1-like protein 21 [Tanacetum cinerariifolium]
DYNFYCLLQNVEIEEDRVDDRSVDDLLLFINSGNEGSRGICLKTNSVWPERVQGIIPFGQIGALYKYLGIKKLKCILLYTLCMFEDLERA